MPGISVAQQGFTFVIECFRSYWGSCLLLLFYLAGVVWSLLRHRRQEAFVFVLYTVFLALTVYNPLLITFVIEKADIELEYYRFLWILPVIPGTAYYIVRIVFSFRNRVLAAAAAFAAAAVIVVTGTPIDGIVENFQCIENIYKVPNDLRAVCDVIHQDSKIETPMVVFDSKYNPVARQYDASLKLAIKRNAQLVHAGSEAVDVDVESKSYKRQKTIMDALYFGMDVKVKKFRKALKKLNVDYLVLPQISAMHEYVKSCGCTVVAQTETRIIYKSPYSEA